MPVNPLTFFGLQQNFTLEQLKNARNNKLNALAKFFNV